MQVAKHPIKTVADNKEKGLSYKENFKRYKKAKESEFYLECLWILYAMLEDRTSSFLYYLGFTGEKKRSSATGNKRIKPQIRRILHMVEPNEKYRFDSISGKLSRIIEVIEWSKIPDEETTDYQSAIRKAVKNLADNEDLRKALDYLNDEWRDKRNQLTHSLFNKDPDTVVAELRPLVEKGYVAVRVLDSSISQLKKEKIRIRFRIQ